MPSYSYYTIPGSETQYRTDGSKTWYKNRFNTWTLLRTGHGPTYNRFKTAPIGRGAPRAASAVVRDGSGFSYAEHSRAKKVKLAQIAQGEARHAHLKRARLGSVMGESATAHAAAQGAPPLSGYEWCHLWGHGLGGTDQAGNLVAASKHANSEQLQMERIVHGYRNKGIVLRVGWERFGGDPLGRVARTIVFELLFGGRVIYSRNILGLRATAPTWAEVARVGSDVTAAITKAFNQG